jgi:uncharacterized cupin superfamily protein
MPDRHPNVVNSADLPWHEFGHGDNFASRCRRLAETTGGQLLGCNLYEVPPGKKAWPFHAHHANEEAVYVLDGAGSLRIGEKTVPIRAGDYLAFLPGEATAHQILNDSDAPLRYLCFSTMITPEIVMYPDSGKLGLAIGQHPDIKLRAILPRDAEVDYWQGER